MSRVYTYDTIPDNGMSRVHSGNNSAMFTYLTDSVYTLNCGGCMLKTPNWVPGVYDKVPLCPF